MQRSRKRNASLVFSGSAKFLKSPIVRICILLLAIGLGLSWLIPQPATSQRPRDVELTLVSFAVTRAAYQKIIPGFVNKWKREHNQNVSFQESYGGSGSQTRAVIDGLEADVCHQSFQCTFCLLITLLLGLCSSTQPLVIRVFFYSYTTRTFSSGDNISYATIL